MIKTVQMKNSIKILLLILSLAFFSSSCVDELPDLSEDSPAELLVGTWGVVENSATYGQQNYEVAFYVFDLDDKMVKIFNFYGLGSWSHVLAGVDGNTITITEQTVEGHKIVGTGTISDDFKTIEFEYNVEEVSVVKSANSEDVTATFTKK